MANFESRFISQETETQTRIIRIELLGLKHTGNLFRENLQLIGYVNSVDFKPFRLQVKGKHSVGRKFQSLAVRGKKLLT